MPSARAGARASAGPKAPKLGGGDVSLDAGVFRARFNMPVVHEAVRAELAARRHGTASTKTRGEVSGGGAKPWRQKGTGRARAGSSRSPVWTGGGTVFGPTPRRYTFRINRKERRAALRSALSVHAERESLAVFDAGAFDGPSTAQAVGLLNDWNPAEPVLIVLGGEEEAAGKSFRNIARVQAVPVEDVGVAEVMGAASLLVSETALPALVARAGTPARGSGEAAAPSRERDAKRSTVNQNASRSAGEAPKPAADAAPEPTAPEPTAADAAPSDGDAEDEA